MKYGKIMNVNKEKEIHRKYVEAGIFIAANKVAIAQIKEDRKKKNEEGYFLAGQIIKRCRPYLKAKRR